MNWGVLPAIYQGAPSDIARIEFAISVIRELDYAGSGDTLIVTAGHHQLAGGTDMIRVVTL
jgi:pyruvate kinase